MRGCESEGGCESESVRGSEGEGESVRGCESVRGWVLMVASAAGGAQRATFTSVPITRCMVSRTSEGSGPTKLRASAARSATNASRAEPRAMQ